MSPSMRTAQLQRGRKRIKLKAGARKERSKRDRSKMEEGTCGITMKWGIDYGYLRQ